MKRYRVLAIDFDTRATVLTQEIKAEWEPHVREQWARNQVAVREDLVAQYGSFAFDAKVRNFISLGALPMSVLAFHNRFHSQARDAFVVGAYYPALTGVCRPIREEATAGAAPAGPMRTQPLSRPRARVSECTGRFRSRSGPRRLPRCEEPPGPAVSIPIDRDRGRDAVEGDELAF